MKCEIFQNYNDELIIFNFIARQKGFKRHREKKNIFLLMFIFFFSIHSHRGWQNNNDGESFAAR